MQTQTDPKIARREEAEGFAKKLDQVSPRLGEWGREAARLGSSKQDMVLILRNAVAASERK